MSDLQTPDSGPSREQFGEMARSGATVIPVWRHLLADGITPVSALHTFGQGPGSFLLESVSQGEAWSRYSFVGFAPKRIVRGKGEIFEQEILSTGKVKTEEGVDPYRRLSEVMAAWRAPDQTVDALPPFWGGAVGYIAYDAVRRFEPTVAAPTAQDDWEFCFGVGATVLVFDNLKKWVTIVATATVMGDVGEAWQDAHQILDEVEAGLCSPKTLRVLRLPRAESSELPASTFERGAFEDAVRTVQEHIRDGDVFQAVLSQRFSIDAADASLFDVYRAMRVINPSPYMYFLSFEDTDVAGASPETLVRFVGGQACVRPIAGTRPRGRDKIEDAQIADELLADPKERAEHVMLVDLGRNDLGRVCKPGTVKVTEQMLVELYSHVMHIVSNVTGNVDAEVDALDVLKATFPAGTLSGAPKVRAMQIIDSLEPSPRGIYGGAVGYIGYDGNLDMAIAIRTAVKRGDSIQIQAGAGIVIDSDPAKEFEETVNKARAALMAIDAAKAPKSEK